jgi:hypothetical protein
LLCTTDTSILRRKLTMNLLNKAFALFTLCVVTLCALPTQAQNPATWGSASGRYGLSAWAINNQRVASQYNYDIDSTFGGNAISAGAYTFPIGTCTQALAFGGGRNLNPFNANASIRIIDIASGSSETVTPAATPVTYAGGTCTINFTPANTHTSFRLRSGTCGLREALNDLGGLGGEVIVDQKFYDDGCTATTITGLTLSSGAGLQANQYIHDISAGQDTWYGLKGTSLSLNGGAHSADHRRRRSGNVADRYHGRRDCYRTGDSRRDYVRGCDWPGDGAFDRYCGHRSGHDRRRLHQLDHGNRTGRNRMPEFSGVSVVSSANGGATLSEILYAPTSAGCTAAANSVIVTACSLTSNSVVTAIITGTAGIPKSGCGEWRLGGDSGWLPAVPYSSRRPWVPDGLRSLPRDHHCHHGATCGRGCDSGGILQHGWGKRPGFVCGCGYATAAATVAGTFNLTLGPRQATGVQTIDSVPFTASSTWNPAAASNWTYCTILVDSGDRCDGHD